MSSPVLQIDTTKPFVGDTLAAEKSPIFRKYGSGSRAQDESRKLLSHLLNQLENRRMPPPAYDAFKDLAPAMYDGGLAAIVDTVRGAVRMKRAAAIARNQSSGNPADEDDSDSDEDEDIFSTDFTLDLLGQVKDVLIVSLAQRWQIFDYTSSFIPEPTRSRPSRSKSPRSSTLNVVGRRTRSISPAPRAPSSGNLLLRCINVLNSICLEDCRYKISHPRPSRPPFSLQALALDVALYLIHSSRTQPTIVTKVALAMLPALSTFPPPMYQRLLAFFDNIFRIVLEDLRELRTSQASQSQPGLNGYEDKSSSFEQPGDFSVSIQIEEVGDTPATIPFKPWSLPEDPKIVSTNTPGLHMSLYNLASLCKPFLSVLLHVIDVTPQSSIEERTLAYIFRILRFCMEAKFDLHSDLLEVVAYGSSCARLGAISILRSVWPLATGHTIASRPWLLSKYSQLPGHPCRHEFVPWNFGNNTECGVCTSGIIGFGLLCPFCNLFSLHFGCFDDPEGTKVFEYSDEHVERVATLHFSLLESRPTLLQRDGHIFSAVHFFSLTLCHWCRYPIWGVFSQGLQCQSCWQAMHHDCAKHGSQACTPCGTPPSPDDLTISWNALQESFTMFFQDISSLTPDNLSYEEVSVLHATLYAQMHILTLGIGSGSIIVRLPNGRSAATSKDFQINPFALHHLLDGCERQLASRGLAAPSVVDFLEENNLDTSTNFLCIWSGVLFVASTIKSPVGTYPTSSHSTQDHLQVSQNDAPSDSPTEPPYEGLCIAHLRDALGFEFNINSDGIARLLLQRLYFLGFYQPSSTTAVPFDGMFDPRTQCHFPLPLGLDLSPEVEVLAASVESCLDDIDLAVNEFGFLQLVRRFPCNGLVSDYALSRMAASVIGWILNEDNHLATVLRNVAKLPGVRSPNDPPPWPARGARDVRPTPGSTSVNNGGDYVATRRNLASLYALPWLREVHDRDPIAFGKLVFDMCAADVTFRADLGVEQKADSVDQLLQKLIKLAQSLVLFSSFDYVIMSWLRLVSATGAFRKPMPSLYRLYPHEYDSGQRFSSATEAPALVKDNLGSLATDPWKSVQELVSHEEARTAVHAFSVFARSGVDVPLSIFTYVGKQLEDLSSEFDQAAVFVHALFASIWMQPKGRDSVLSVLLSIHERFGRNLFDDFVDQEDLEDRLMLVRQTLSTTLLLYGCERPQLQSAGLVLEADIVDLPSRRRQFSRNSTTEDPVIVHPDIIQSIGHYVATGNTQVSILIAKFFSLFLATSPLLESHEIDNFILQNSEALCDCAWQFYSLDEIVDSRSALLLRILSVDHRPFLKIIHDLMVVESWEARFLTIGRLFRIVLDVTGPSFREAEGHWQPNILAIFYTFFEAMWSDRSEEVRQEVETCSSNLLPTHFNAMARIWDQALFKLPQEERLQLVSFMIQLHPHFPKWQMLSWPTILEGLREISDEPALRTSIHTLTQDISDLRVALLLLSLQMISDGVHADISTILQIKVQVLDCLGFQNVSTNMTPRGLDVRFGDLPEFTTDALPLIPELVLILDSSYRLPSTQQPGILPPIVGLCFVDLVLTMFSTADRLISLPTLTLKSLLEALTIAINKHDFETTSMRYLQPLLRRSLTRTVELLLENPNYDLCQMCLATMQAFMESSVSSFMGGVISHSLAAAMQVIDRHSQHRQDALLAQAKTFVLNTLKQFSAQGVFLNLLRRSLDSQAFLILRQILGGDGKQKLEGEMLRESLLRDTVLRIAELDAKTLPGIARQLEKFIVNVFYQGYSKDLIALVANQLVFCSRRIDDFPSTAENVAPFLGIPAILIQHNKANCREMLLGLDAILRNVMPKLPVQEECLVRLLDVASAFHRRVGTDDTLVHSHITIPLRDIMLDGLRCRIALSPVTILTFVNVFLRPESPHSFADPQYLSTLTDPCLIFLQVHRWLQHSQEDLDASVAVAGVLAVTAKHDPNVIRKLGEQDKARPMITLRTWNVLLLSALQQEPRDEAWLSTLFAQFNAFVALYRSVLRNVGDSVTDSFVIDINHAYLAVKLWLICAFHRGQHQDQGDTPTLRVWNQLWAPFEGLVNGYEKEVRIGVSSPIILLTLSSCADLLQFVHNLQCPVGMHSMAHIETLERLKGLGGSSATKISRALKGLSEAPQSLPGEVMLSQIGKEIIAAEKLRMLEHGIKPGGERTRG